MVAEWRRLRPFQPSLAPIGSGGRSWLFDRLLARGALSASGLEAIEKPHNRGVVECQRRSKILLPHRGIRSRQVQQWQPTGFRKPETAEADGQALCATDVPCGRQAARSPPRASGRSFACLSCLCRCMAGKRRGFRTWLTPVVRYATSRVCPRQYCARRSRFKILPLGTKGRLSAKSMLFGTL